MSLVWKYFRVKENDPSKVVCLLCYPLGEDSGVIPKFLSRGSNSKSYSTKPMWNHLRCVHPDKHRDLTQKLSAPAQIKTTSSKHLLPFLGPLTSLPLPFPLGLSLSQGGFFKRDDKKVSVAASAGGSLAPGLDENSAGSGEGPTTGCDEVSVPLSPEQFLSEDMERGASPGTPSSQRPESYKLRHNNHLTLVLESLAGDESFMDVTLTAQGKAIKAHKSVLSAVSPYFRSVLKQNPCQHPIIIMPRDVRFDELSNIISYVYKGEMTVAAEDLSSLLKTAEVLQVTGLSPSEGSNGPGGIMSQMQGLPSGVFPSTSTSSSSSSSKNGSKKTSKQTTQTQVAAEEVSQASVGSEPQSKIDPLEFLNADMTCVKEEIQSENEETEDSNFGLSMDTSETVQNHPESVETSPNRRRSVSSPVRSSEDLTGKPFNPGEHGGGTSPDEETPESLPLTTPYLCPHCLETHRPNEALHSHLRLKHPSKPFFICACSRVFIRQSVFTEHSKKCTF